MPGPLPKDPKVRQRRNKTSTKAVLKTEIAPLQTAPELPPRSRGKWHPLTERWWHDVWASPMRGEYVQADIGSLFRLVMLVDKFWRRQSLEVAKEIRLLEREFGLTPLSRRRLEWTVAQTDEATAKRDAGQLKRARPIDVTARDPREVLDA